ncbi:glycosyltransferase family 4 protein [Sphingobacterium lactis]|uniref:glycosyltransferase family 4 protein n=1 Tax=Sphingobacterium lactis TaxID=797291 RepID=UPI003EC94C88
MIKIVKTSTVPISLSVLLKGQLKFLSKYFEIVGVSSPGPELGEIARREDVRVQEVHMERGINPLKDAVSLINMVKLLRKERPMIIHSITPKAGLISMLAGWITGVPIRMHTFTGLIFPSKTGVLQKLLIMMDKLLCFAATNIYPEGNGVKKDLIKFRITDKELSILGNGNVNGVDLEYFDTNLFSDLDKENIRSKINLSKDDFVFVFVGRLVRDKGVNELIGAFDELVKTNGKIKLLLIGSEESDLDPLHRSSLDAISTNPNIIKLGFQKDIRPFLAISDCMVFPSYREGFPNVVLQAGAMEVPCIVTDINGSNEIISDGINGVIVPVKDENSLKNAMIRIYNNPDLLMSFKLNTRKIIEEKFDQKYVWTCILEEYQRLINEKNKNNV